MAKSTYKQNTYKNQPKKNNRNIDLNKITKNFFSDDKSRLSLGIIFLIFAFALLVAFTSYLYTGRDDQSLVQSIWGTSLTEAGAEVNNWLGLTGALLSHFFIFQLFGISSFFFVFIFFALGWKLVFRTEIAPLLRSMKFSIFTMLWISLFFGTFHAGNTETGISFSAGFWAGGAGFVLSSILYDLFGMGTLLILFIILGLFFIYFVRPYLQNSKTFSSIKSSIDNVNIAFDRTQNTQKRSSISDDEIFFELDEEDDSVVLEVNDDEANDLEKTVIQERFQKKKKPSNTKKKENKNTDLELEIDQESVDEMSAQKQKKRQKSTKPSIETKQEKTNDTFFEVDEEPKFQGLTGFQKRISFEEQEDDIMPAKANLFSENEVKETKKDLSQTKDLGIRPPKNEVQEPIFNLEDVEIEQPKEIQKPSEEDKVLPTNTDGEFDPTLELSKYKRPTIELLDEARPVERRSKEEIKAELEANKDKIVETLSNYGIGISHIKATIGPTVTLYQIIPEAGVKISKIRNLEDDIALSLAALGIRIIAPIPGKGTIGIEVPNKKREIVALSAVINDPKFEDTDKALPVIIGKTVSNEVIVADLAKMPHLLMAGATGQGKSVGLNIFLTSLIYKKHPAELKFVLVDPKKVELTLFNTIEKHFLAKLPESEEAIITETDKVVNTLNSLTLEMDNRYNMLKDATCRNIKEYNKKFLARKLNPKKGHRFLPYIVLVIDELADLMMTAGKEVEQPIARLAQLARAIGIHLIVATQRPSVNVITGMIKANFPARMSFKVTSVVDSRTILDAKGAEQLVGMGDMLFSMGSEITRLQCPFIDTPEVERICNYIGAQQGYERAYQLPEFMADAGNASAGSSKEMERDVLFEEAARIIVTHQQGSTSLLQRRLKLGYNRAGRIIDQLEALGVVGPNEGSKAREVLIPDEYALERLLNTLD